MPFPFSEEVILPTGAGPFYVPTDLDDALRELGKMLQLDDLARIHSGTEDEMPLHHREFGA